MKNFLIKLSVLIIPFIVLLLVLNFIFSKSYWWNSFSTEQERFRHVSKNIQIANLGSSLTDIGLDYEDFPEYVTFNFALMWQHNLYNYYVFKNYADYFAPNSILLIPISYFDITRIENEQNWRYYIFLSKENIPGWKLKDYIVYNYFPLFSIKNAWKTFVNMNNKQYWMAKYNTTYEDFLSQSEMYFSWWMGNDPAVEKGEEGFQYNINYVSKIIDLCYEKNIIPVLISTPIMDCLNDKYSEAGFFDTFYRFTNELQKKYPNLLYFDYSHDAEYSKDYWSFFIDPAHLTASGAKKFTAQVIQDLKDALILD
ncbi:MAG: hypothetical protein J6T84_01180 [Spirochaetaceae bacterium]|nr:hypothetical protein [Spirochaetaceae bacterium]